MGTVNGNADVIGAEGLDNASKCKVNLGGLFATAMNVGKQLENVGNAGGVDFLAGITRETAFLRTRHLDCWKERREEGKNERRFCREEGRGGHFTKEPK